MKYDFTTIMDRRGRDAIAVDMVGAADGFGPGAPLPGFDPIPMWVADMNFPVVPTIPAAMIERAMHPAYGYFRPTAEYFDSIIRWHRLRNGVEGLQPEHIGYENGVLGGVISALNTFCSRGDKVLVHSPTYIGFTHSLENAGYEIIHSPLVKDADNIWRMDFEDMEQKIRENRIHAAILCSPHNPTGRVWEKWELETAMALYKKYDVYVVSDEIWSDILLTGYKHTPIQSVSEDAKMRTVALYAPSKTFSLAGLVGSYHIIYNRMLRNRMRHLSALSHYNQPNVLSMHALIGAFSAEGEVWANEVCQVIDTNIQIMSDYLKTVPGIKFMRAQGTYMLYLDCTEWCEKNNVSIYELQNRGVRKGVIWQNGEPFQMPNTIRMNLSLPTSQVEEVIRRLKNYVFL